MGIDSNLFNKFTEEVCSQIKCTEVHEDIKEELACHLEDIREEYIAQGSTYEEADKLAISHMGDSEKIGFDLNKIYQKTPEYKTLIICSLFVAFGLFTHFSIFKNAPEVMSYNEYMRVIIFTILGALLGIIVYFFDYRKLEGYSWHIFIGSTILILFTLSFGKSVSGLPRVNFLGITFDTTLISVIFYCISLSGILPKLRLSHYYIIKLTSVIALPAYLILITRQFSSLIIFICLSIVILFYSNLNKRHISAVIGLGLAIFSYCIYNAPYRLYRIKSFINFKNNNYKIDFFLNSKVGELITNANFLGNGASKEVIKNTPIINQDLVYSYVIYTFGWVVGITFFVLVIAMLVNLMRISTTIKSIYGKRLFILISSFLLIQFILSLSMNLNLIPFISISTPFLSYSGVSTVLNMFLVGLICSIYGRKNLSKSLVNTRLQISE